MRVILYDYETEKIRRKVRKNSKNWDSCAMECIWKILKD